MQLDLSLDAALCWDNTEQVQYQSTRNSGSLTGLVPITKRRALNKRELAASGGAYTALDRVWLIPASVMPSGIVPKPADVITDRSGAQWTVLESGHNRHDGSTNPQTFRLTCRDPIVAYDLQDRADVQAALITWNAAGVKTKTFPEQNGGFVRYAGIPARVQENERVIKDERDVRNFEIEYTIYVAMQLPNIDHEDRIKYTMSTGAVLYLDIVSYQNENRIDELPNIKVKLAP